jgi:hypothetical protein
MMPGTPGANKFLDLLLDHRALLTCENTIFSLVSDKLTGS